jgi:hypothetical protein
VPVPAAPPTPAMGHTSALRLKANEQVAPEKVTGVVAEVTVVAEVVELAQAVGVVTVAPNGQVSANVTAVMIVRAFEVGVPAVSHVEVQL